MAFRLVLSAGKLNLPLVPSQDYVLQYNKRCYDKILSDWNFRLPSLGFKCILVGLMNMIDDMQFEHKFFFTDIKQFLLAHGYCCIDKWHAESLWGCPGLNIFKWVVAGGIFPKDEVEQQQLMYFKSKVFTIIDTGWRPPQCIDIAPKKMMVWKKELIVLALQGIKFMHVFFLILYIVSMQCQFRTIR